MMKFKTLELRLKNSPDKHFYRGDSIDRFEYEGGDHLDVYTKNGKHLELNLYLVLDTRVEDGWCINGIEVEEHYGSWYTIDDIMVDGKIYFLCEHEEYGDETANIIIDLDGNLILDEVWNGFEDLADHLDIELDI